MEVAFLSFTFPQQARRCGRLPVLGSSSLVLSLKVCISDYFIYFNPLDYTTKEGNWRCTRCLYISGKTFLWVIKKVPEKKSILKKNNLSKSFFYQFSILKDLFLYFCRLKNKSHNYGRGIN